MKRKYKHDPERVRSLLGWLSAQLLMVDQPYKIELSHEAVRDIVKILAALPESKIARPKEWTHEIEIRAIFDMLDDKSVEETARWIVEETGQDEASAIRRLWDLKESLPFQGMGEALGVVQNIAVSAATATDFFPIVDVVIPGTNGDDR